MASEKNLGGQNSGESHQLATSRLKEKLIWKIINNRTNLMNSTRGSITSLSLFPSCSSETRHECTNLLQQSKGLKTCVWCFRPLCNRSWNVLPLHVFLRRVICHQVSSPSRFLFLVTDFFLWRLFKKVSLKRRSRISIPNSTS